MSAVDVGRAMELLRAAVAREGSVAAVARRIGYARSSVSMALSGTYVGGLEKMSATILAVLGTVSCPHLGAEITPDECRSHHDRPMPTSSPRALRHWQACRSCEHRKGGADAEQ